MARVGAKRAAELTGKSKSTIQRAMNSGKVTFELDNNGRRVIDVSELERAFGLAETKQQGATVEHELEKAQSMIELERLKVRVQMLEDQLDSANERIEELKVQRDQWQKQASQVLLTSEHTQKQAEEYKAELKEWEKRAKEIRQRKLAQKQKTQKKILGDSQTSDQAESTETDSDSNAIKKMWQN